MSASFALRTVIEIVLSVLLIVGFIYEEKVIAFEKALAECIRIRLRRYLKRKSVEKTQVKSSTEHTDGRSLRSGKTQNTHSASKNAVSRRPGRSAA